MSRSWTATVSVYPGDPEVTYHVSWWRPGVPLRWPAKPHVTLQGTMLDPQLDDPKEFLQAVLTDIARHL